MIKVSVIIPVYNGEKYIEACIESVLNQTLKEVEIIIVNDASTDNTQSIIEKYSIKYSDKIKVVTKDNNEGQGKARNIGINLATGEFITFVDSDDTISESMLEKMYDIAKEKGADVILCDYYEIIKENKTIQKALLQRTNDIKKDFVTWIAGPCNKLIQTELLKKNNLYFLEVRAYEDISMMPLVGVYAKKIIYIEEPLYNYYIRHGSTMRQKTFNNKLLSIYDALEYLAEGFKKSELLKEYQEELEFIYIKHLLYAGTGRFLEYKEGKKEVRKIVSIVKRKFPNWRKNKYYKKQDGVFKLNCNIFYSNCLFVIVPFRTIINYMKRR